MRAEQEQREDDAENAAAAAIDVDAAEHDGGDDEQDRAVGVVAARRAVLADPDQRGEPGERAGERIGLDLELGDVDAGDPRGVLVVADRIAAPAEHRPVHQEADGDRDHEEEEERDRQRAEELGRADEGVGVVEARCSRSRSR